MANRIKFNREDPNAKNDTYRYEDLIDDYSYMESKPRDIFSTLTNPPYIIEGISASVSVSDSSKIAITSGVAFDREFREIRFPQTNNYPLFVNQSGIIQYLTLEYSQSDVPSSLRVTKGFGSTQTPYISKKQDSYRLQWKLQSPILPAITGNNPGPFNIIKDYNDVVVISTDISVTEHIIKLNSNVSSISTDEIDIVSGGVFLNQDDNIVFSIGSNTFDFALTSSPSGEILSLSQIALRVNSGAYSLMGEDVAFTVSGENKIRITHPVIASGNPILSNPSLLAVESVYIGSGLINSKIGLTENTISYYSVPLTVSDVETDINNKAGGETVAFVDGSFLRLRSMSPGGYITVTPHNLSAIPTFGLTYGTTHGAPQIDLNNDIIITNAQYISGAASIDNSQRTGTLTLQDYHAGWRKTFVTDYTMSGNVTFDMSDEYYVVGDNELMVFVNGQYRHGNGVDYEEVGPAGTRSRFVTVYDIEEGYVVDILVPKMGTKNLKEIPIKLNDVQISPDVTEFNFGPEFNVSESSGSISISLQYESGSVASHAERHGYLGEDEINVENLRGKLFDPQNILVSNESGTLVLKTNRLNFKGDGVSVEDVSGDVFVNIPETSVVNHDGNIVFRIGYNDAGALSNIYLEDFYYSGLAWKVDVTDDGSIVTEPAVSGTPFVNPIIESPSGNRYKLFVNNIPGVSSGEILTLLSSGTPDIIKLTSASNKSFLVKVTDSGEVYTTDPLNVFQINDFYNSGLFSVDESGMISFKIFDYSSLPAPDTADGKIIFSDNSGAIEMLVSQNSGWINIFSYPVSNKISRSGDAMTGPLYLSGDPVLPDEAANRNFVLSSISGALTFATSGDIVAGSGESLIVSPVTLKAKLLRQPELITVGPGGDFSNMNDALYNIVDRYNGVAFSKDDIKVELRLVSGFVMQEQVEIKNINLGWVNITSEESGVVINSTDITDYNVKTDIDGYVLKKAVFYGDNAVMPEINTNFIFSGDKTDVYGMYLNRSTARVISGGIINSDISVNDNGYFVSRRSNLSFSSVTTGTSRVDIADTFMYSSGSVSSVMTARDNSLINVIGVTGINIDNSGVAALKIYDSKIVLTNSNFNGYENGLFAFNSNGRIESVQLNGSASNAGNGVELYANCNFYLQYTAENRTSGTGLYVYASMANILGCTLTGNSVGVRANAGIVSVIDSYLNAQGCINMGLSLTNGSKFTTNNNSSVNFRKGVSDSPADISITGGSIYSQTNGYVTGGHSISPNVIGPNGEGIFFNYDLP